MGLGSFGLAYYGQKFQYKQIEKWIAKYVSEVPEEDWTGIDRVYVYDEAPADGRQDVSGGYYPPGQVADGAGIAIYLSQTLGYIFSFHRKSRSLIELRNRIFLITFGKLFIEHTLFHEVGHHKYRLQPDNEKEAGNYAHELFVKVHPFIHRYYRFMNGIYRFLYVDRRRHDDEIRSKYKGGTERNS